MPEKNPILAAAGCGDQIIPEAPPKSVTWEKSIGFGGKAKKRQNLEDDDDLVYLLSLILHISLEPKMRESKKRQKPPSPVTKGEM